MKRNLKFWTRHTWETAGVELMVVAFFSIITIISNNGLDWSLFFSTVPLFLLVASVFCMIIVNSSTQLLYNPLLLSMGETRRSVFFGSCYYRALIVGVTVALCGLLWLLAPGSIADKGLGSLFNISCVLVIASALGNLFGTLYVKWKWVGVMLLALTGGVAGGLGGFAFSAGIHLKQSSIEKVSSFLQELPWWVALIAVGLFALDLIFHWMLLRRQEVKL